MAYGRRRNSKKKFHKLNEKLVNIITSTANKYLYENIRNKRNEVYGNDFIKMKNQIEYIINMDRKLNFFYKKSNLDLYQHLTGFLDSFNTRLRKSNDINKYLNHYHKINILINGNQNNLIEN